MRAKLLKKLEGFTIIEVMIVLAIAGLIMVIVFVAIPQLQRNQRNTRRKDNVNRVKAEVDNFASNNNGNYPAADATATNGFSGGFATRYLSNVNYQDPQSGTNMTLSPATPASGSGGTAIGTINYALGRVCAGETSTTTAATARNYTLLTQLEGGATYCVDNS